MCYVTVALLSVAAAGSIAGAGVSAYGSYRQGQYQKKMANYQADLETQRAAAAQEAAANEIQEAAAQRRQQAGAARTAAAAAGSMLDSSTLDSSQMWEQDQAYIGAYETEKIRRNAELAQWGFSSAAAAERSQGKMSAWSGNMGAIGSIIGGVGQAFGYAGEAYESYQTRQRMDALKSGQQSGAGQSYVVPKD